MPTTTIRIEDSLKERVAAAAERAGKTSHAFIVDAIAQTVEQAEAEDAVALYRYVANIDTVFVLALRSHGERAG